MEKGISIVYTPHIDKMDLEVINEPLFFCVLQETWQNWESEPSHMSLILVL